MRQPTGRRLVAGQGHSNFYYHAWLVSWLKKETNLQTTKSRTRELFIQYLKLSPYFSWLILAPQCLLKHRNQMWTSVNVFVCLILNPFVGWRFAQCTDRFSRFRHVWQWLKFRPFHVRMFDLHTGFLHCLGRSTTRTHVAFTQSAWCLTYVLVPVPENPAHQSMFVRGSSAKSLGTSSRKASLGTL